MKNVLDYGNGCKNAIIKEYFELKILRNPESKRPKNQICIIIVISQCQRKCWRYQSKHYIIGCEQSCTSFAILNELLIPDSICKKNTRKNLNLLPEPNKKKNLSKFWWVENRFENILIDVRDDKNTVWRGVCIFIV